MIRKLFILNLFAGFLGYLQPAIAGRISPLEKAEDSLKKIILKMTGQPDDSARAQSNKLFLTELKSALDMPGSFDYAFDSLKTLGKLTSPDNKLRFYSWNQPMNDGSNRYFCLLQVKQTEKNIYQVYTLTDASDLMETPGTKVLSSSQWYGALYYKVIGNEGYDGKTVYTLLGWDGNSSLTSSKVIDILSFDNDGKPQFGALLFPDYGNGQSCRIIFTYSSSARMTLRYEDQTIKKGTKIQELMRKAGISEDKIPMIVFDRLVPLDPQFEGLRQYYVPSADTYEGFVFIGHNWRFVSDVDARNK